MSGATTHTPAVATPASPAMSFGPTLRLQRKCSCGSAKCDACGKKKKGLQAKLEVGASDDHFEREADRAAEQVMNGAHAPGATAAPMQLQRVGGGASGLGEAPAEVQQVLGSPGSALDAGSRSFFESRFGHDFSRVRVHHDAQADASARAVGAKAYTVGSNVVFASGQYAPHSSSGRHLMAHELAHVVQQGQGGARLQRKPKAPACTQTESYSPALKQKAKVLSSEEVAKDVSRRNALDVVGETGVRVFSTPSWGKKEKPRDIAAGTEVTITEVVKSATVCKGTGAVHPTGSGFYKIAWAAESGYVFSPVLDEVQEAPTKPSLKIDLTLQICQAPDRLIIKKPLNFRTIGQQAEEEFKAGASPLKPKLRTTLEGSLDGDLERAMKIWGKDAPPPVYSIPLSMGILEAQQEIRRRSREEYIFLIPPWADIQYYTVPDLMPGERTMAIVVPFPELLEDYQDAMLAPSRESVLAVYFDAKVDKKVIQAQDMATAKRIKNITQMLEALGRLQPEARSRFDTKALGKMTDWGSFENLLTAHLAREKSVDRLMKSTPGGATGTDLDTIVQEQEGVEPETTGIGTRRDAMVAEQERRKEKRSEWEASANTRAEELKAAPDARVDYEGQKDMLLDVFTMGFMAGAQYEIPPDDWGRFYNAVTKESGDFSAGIFKGLLPGAWDGVVEAFKGLVDLAVLAAELGYKLTAEPVVDLYRYFKDKEKFNKEQEAKNAALRASASVAAAAVWEAFKAFVANPAFLATPAFTIGDVVGRSIGKTLHDKLLSSEVSVSDKGYVVGEVIGRVIIEIVMLVFAPEELLLKGGAKTGIEAGKAAKAIEGLASEVPALRKLLELKELRTGARVVEEGAGARTVGPAAKGLDEASDGLRAGEKLSEGSKADGLGSKVDDLSEAAKANKVHAREPLGDGHHLEMTDAGVCLCSPPPCPKMRTTFKRELDANPDLSTRLDKIEAMSDKVKAGQEAEKVYEELQRLKKLEAMRAKYRRDPERLLKDFKPEVKADPSLKEPIEEAQRSYIRDGEVSDGEIDDVLGLLEQAREAGRPGRAAKVEPYFKDMDALAKRARKAEKSSKSGSKASKEIEEARADLAKGVQERMPEGTKVKVVSTERTAAGDAQGAAASRGDDLPNPDIDYVIDLPDDLRKRIGVPKRGKKGEGVFKPDDIRFAGKNAERFTFVDHKEMLAPKWSESYYATEAGRTQLRDQVRRDAEIVTIMGPNCDGFQYTTNSNEMAVLLNDLIVEVGSGAKQGVKVIR